MESKKNEWGLHWFRRDLRIPGNEALKFNWKRHQGRTLGLFCFDSQFLSRGDFSHNRFAFFLKTLAALKEDLVSQGGDLLVIDATPDKALPQLIHFFKNSSLGVPTRVTWNRDYEPFARKRDAAIKAILDDLAIEHHTFRDHLFFEPEEIVKSDKKNLYYKVYSPFSRNWLEQFYGKQGQQRLATQRNVHAYFSRKNKKTDLFKMNWSEVIKESTFPFKDSLNGFIEKNSKEVTVPIPEAGFYVAYQKLLNFKDHLSKYQEQRDFPGLEGTSQLSLFLKNGSLTVAQIIATLELEKDPWREKTGAMVYLKELIWREFYYAILYHFPEVEEKSFLKHYESLAWEENADHFARWKNGTTGFPIVDAGMRQLAQTGWMHNRVRMIVASFLTKDLLINWQWGERHFMKTLLDGDLAPNNGGWQWAASTGCDPQPYFRIFNPWTQGANFDPEGVYIKTYVKELENIPVKDLHNPNADRSCNGYPEPIVDHSEQRRKALLLYAVRS